MRSTFLKGKNANVLKILILRGIGDVEDVVAELSVLDIGEIVLSLPELDQRLVVLREEPVPAAVMLSVHRKHVLAD
jgi:hypothetical protein